jgi:3'(2'), 5'-bisphosphate nucleotidase
MENVSDLAGKIFAIADGASEILMKYFKQILQVEFKKDEFDPVTVADRESDEFVREQLHKLFPSDLILSEENGNIPQDYSGRVWMVDPLDGTKEFLKGRDCFGINIGLLENGEPVFGCLYIPARNKVFYAEKGKGAFEKKGNKFEQLLVNDIKTIEMARLVTRNFSGETRPIEEEINKMSFLERIPEGGIGAKLTMIASGNAEAHINTNFKVSKWDTLATGLILEEAGGVITDFDGKKLDYTKPSPLWDRSFVASNNWDIHVKIIERLK